MQRGIAGHESLDARDVIGVNRLLEMADLLERLYVRLELRPARESVEARELELRSGDGCRGEQATPRDR